MPSRKANGWSGILDGVDEPPAEERTDPHLDASNLRFDDPDAISDAPAGESLPSPPLKVPAAQAPVAKAPAKVALPRIPTPATQIAMKSELVPPPPQVRATSAPGGRLKLPSPVKSSGGSPIPSAPLVSESGKPAFSTEHLMDKLGDPDEDATPSAPARGPKASGGVWTEYKEVIVSAVGGGLLLLGVLLYQRFSSVEPLVIGDVPPADPSLVGTHPGTPVDPNNPATPSADAGAAQQAILPPPAVPVPPPVDTQPKKAAVPMISLLSSPSGASVEINGESQGKTPLISPAPPNLVGMKVTLRLEGYKKWSGEVQPNEQGNYSLFARLEPSK
jgi:hypothetical protein